MINTDHVWISDFHPTYLPFLLHFVDAATLKKRQHGSNQATHRCVVLPIYIVHTRWYCMFIQNTVHMSMF